MTALEAATLYKQVVALHDAIPDDEATAKDLVASFRSNIHHILMDTFREQGIEFYSRDEAARIAFRLAGDDIEPIPATDPGAQCPF